jgi:putative transposase
MNRLVGFFQVCRALLAARACLVAENIALRHQINVLQRSVSRPRLQPRDRIFWVWLSRWFGHWRSWLAIVKPETIIAWHRLGFRVYWRWKSRGSKPGRPTVSADIRRLIRKMTAENPTWGAPRIRAELVLLGHPIAQSTVAKYMPRSRRPPSQTWRTFLANHMDSLASMDLFTVPPASFRLLLAFVVLRHERRQIVHVNATLRPTAAWVSQQIREAFPFGETPRFLIRDRDGIYGDEVQGMIRRLGIEEVVTAPRSHWQNPFVERLIGSLRREVLDHVIVWNERHLKCILSDYLDYYHHDRSHRALDQNAPFPREIEPPERGQVIAIPRVGGLHHRYKRAA